MKTASGKLRKVRAGHYQYITGGKVFVITNVGPDIATRPLWHCCEQIGDDPFCYGAAFDADETLREAKHWCDVAAGAD